jgi:hypothetical protein
MNLDELIQLDETRLDKTAVLQQIEQNLAKRQFSHPTSFPTFQLQADGLANNTLSPELRQKLAQLNEQVGQLWLDPQLPPAHTITQQVSNWLKRPFHQLVVFYVNKLGEQQNEINDQMRHILSRLIAEIDRPDPPTTN